MIVIVGGRADFRPRLHPACRDFAEAYGITVLSTGVHKPRQGRFRRASGWALKDLPSKG